MIIFMQVTSLTELSSQTQMVERIVFSADWSIVSHREFSSCSFVRLYRSLSLYDGFRTTPRTISTSLQSGISTELVSFHWCSNNYLAAGFIDTRRLAATTSTICNWVDVIPPNRNTVIHILNPENSLIINFFSFNRLLKHM